MAKRYAVFALLLLAACSSSGKTVPSAEGASGNATASLVGHGQAKQTVRADIAFVVVEPGISDGSSGVILGGSSQEVTPQQRGEVLAQLKALGIGASTVHFDSEAPLLGNDPGTTVRVEIPVSRLSGLASKVADAITGVIGTQTTSGLRFAVADCSAALTTARPAAIADARRHAQALARAAHVTLGELRAVNEGSSNSIEAAYFSALGVTQPCGRSSVEASSELSGYGSGTALLPLDAESKVELTFSVTASYALGAPAARTMTATGTGEIEGSADRADILVSPSIDGGLNGLNGPQRLTASDRERIVSGVRAFGVPERDIEVETQGGDVFSYMRVHLDVSRFRANGTRIVDVVKTVIGEEVQAGVFFTASNCGDLVDRAREKAVADADKRLADLARAAKVRLGDITGLDEPSTGLEIFPHLDSCHPDFSVLDSAGGLFSIVSSGANGLGGASLQALDAEPRVRERVAVSETRAITG